MFDAYCAACCGFDLCHKERLFTPATAHPCCRLRRASQARVRTAACSPSRCLSARATRRSSRRARPGCGCGSRRCRGCPTHAQTRVSVLQFMGVPCWGASEGAATVDVDPTPPGADRRGGSGTRARSTIMARSATLTAADGGERGRCSRQATMKIQAHGAPLPTSDLDGAWAAASRALDRARAECLEALRHGMIPRQRWSRRGQTVRAAVQIQIQIHTYMVIYL